MRERCGRMMGIVVVLLAIVGGCPRSGPDGNSVGENRVIPQSGDVQCAREPGEPGYITLIRRAATDEAKWAIIVEGSRGARSREGEDDVERARRNVVCLIRLCYALGPLVVHYPGVTKHIALGPDDLLQTAQWIGSDERDHWGASEPGQEAHGVSKYTKGQVAAAWLKHLIGRTFADRAAFERWFVDHESLLYWDQEAGRFGLREAKGKDRRPSGD